MIDSNDNEFVPLVDNIFILLRSHQKIPENLLGELYEKMREIEFTYRSSYTIPKWLAALLFDLSIAIYSAIDSYPREEREHLFLVFDNFSEIAREILNG